MKKSALTWMVAALVCADMTSPAPSYAQQPMLHNVVTGEPLDLEEAQEEDRDTPGVTEFLETGRNPYNSQPACLTEGESLFLSACSACHGHYGEGKIGPALSDEYWTYTEGLTDAGLFSIIFGGARSSMGPQYLALSLDEMLQVMAWVRYLYDGDPKRAEWMTQEEREAYEPYEQGRMPEVAEGEVCEP